ncbi:uncharacterized protein LOC114569209 isoform X2 [Perca flavescens]|uniref:uncharacterized protein LOC114569209 isoform X2 n=1 Tax=Perca flavescens TaxID=8167 RepID=UPI00106F09C8|nr:uncharacterized protein LOC114569209 isoform X2 [Perca flavescens]XP_028454810.1 uncharacterized protein LOC114569209 isoform X2 [Perca flavescens]
MPPYRAAVSTTPGLLEASKQTIISSLLLKTSWQVKLYPYTSAPLRLRISALSSPCVTHRCTLKVVSVRALCRQHLARLNPAKLSSGRLFSRQVELLESSLTMSRIRPVTNALKKCLSCSLPHMASTCTQTSTQWESLTMINSVIADYFMRCVTSSTHSQGLSEVKLKTPKV